MEACIDANRESDRKICCAKMYVYLEDKSLSVTEHVKHKCDAMKNTGLRFASLFSSHKNNSPTTSSNDASSTTGITAFLKNNIHNET
jgi:hypothetical protein